MSKTSVIISCEHGGNDVPEEYTHILKYSPDLLESHRGYDHGALDIAQFLADTLDAPLFAATVTRLLVDCNRSPGSRNLFSSLTRGLSPLEKATIFDRFYRPYRTNVENAVSKSITDGNHVLHLSLHTFTPILDGIERRADTGLLYDHARQSEKLLCRYLRRRLSDALPDMKIRLNYPYRGTADGFTSYLRKRFADDSYTGIEIEVNQKHTEGSGGSVKIQRALAVNIPVVAGINRQRC